jgi:hypothetical protein
VVIVQIIQDMDAAQDQMNGKDLMEINVVKIPHMVVVVMVLKPELMRKVLTVTPQMM